VAAPGSLCDRSFLRLRRSFIPSADWLWEATTPGAHIPAASFSLKPWMRSSWSSTAIATEFWHPPMTQYQKCFFFLILERDVHETSAASCLYSTVLVLTKPIGRRRVDLGPLQPGFKAWPAACHVDGRVDASGRSSICMKFRSLSEEGKCFHFWQRPTCTIVSSHNHANTEEVNTSRGP
jgi:hypothetical protein